ncbi:MAG: NADH-quinone oxidoreductase subunit C, partial [Candidatus Hodarchaeota archaeon]
IDIFLGADIYEQEIQEMLGVHFIGKESSKHLLLPKKWPKNLYPLRKEHTWNDVKEQISDLDFES